MKKLLLPIFLFGLCNFVFANKTPYFSYYQNVYSLNLSDKSFHLNINARGGFYDDSFIGTVYYGELEEIKSINAFLKNNNKKKKVKKENIYKSDLFTDNFYSGYKALRIDFKKNKSTTERQEFEYNALVRNSELLCISSLYFYQTENEYRDTVENVIKVPNGYRLLINDKDIKTKDGIWIDSTVVNNEKVYTFRKVFHKRKDYLNSRSPKPKAEFISIRVLIYSEGQSPLNYFNNWYQNLLNSIPPSENYKLICDSLSKLNNNRDSLLKNVYKYVTQKIRYIDIENGVNAFRPRPSDEVLYKQQGDCKDMALLLTNMYNYLGFEADIALSSTLSNAYQFDFPTIASANHAICVLKYQNQLFYLDATESNGFYNQPSRQIQDTKAMISRKEGAEIIYIPKKEPSFNTIQSSIHLKISADSIKGVFENEYNGYNKIYIESITENYSSSKVKTILKQFYQGKNYHINYSNINVIKEVDKVRIKGDIELNSNNVYKSGDKYYLNFNFSPFVHSFEKTIDTTENYPLYATSNNQHKITIEFPDKIKKVESAFKNVKIQEHGIEYTFNISHSNNLLMIEYTYSNEHVILKEDSTSIFNMINQLILTTLNHEVIIY